MISDFFIICSGANKEILNACPTERIKFVGIGATICLTAVLASISGGYFLALVFSNKITGKVELSWFYILAFGLLWGLLIFNLDRSIIVSIKKSGIWKEELKQGWVRIALAIFIGVVIATPLELKLFEEEVNAKVEENLKKQLGERKKKNMEIYEIDLKALNQDIGKIEVESKEKEKRRNELYEAFKVEAEGTGGTLKLGKGPVYDEKKKEFDKIDTLYSQSLVQLNTKRAKRDSVFNKIDAIGISDEKNISKINGPEAKIKALYQLSGVHWFITILFILLETLPVFSKLMSKRGPYDEIIDRVEYEHFLQQQKIISDKNDEMNNILEEIKELNKLKGEVRLKTEKAKLEAELSANESLLNDIATKQAKLAKIAIGKWYEDELNRLRGGQPQQYAITKQQNLQPIQAATLEGIMWKAINLKSEVFYFFKSGQQTNNELEYQENGIKQTGTWEYLTTGKEIKISLPNFSETYILEDVTPNSAQLKSSINDSIELIKV
jgi:hypothetical protein